MFNPCKSVTGNIIYNLYKLKGLYRILLKWEITVCTTKGEVIRSAQNFIHIHKCGVVKVKLFKSETSYIVTL